MIFFFLSCFHREEIVFEDSHFSTMMEHFYTVNYSYPTDIDDFFQRFYAEDCRGGYDYLSMVTNQDFSKENVSYELYDSLMCAFQDDASLNWRVLKENKEWLRFEENDSIIMLHHSKYRECYVYPKIEFRVKKYLKGELELDTLPMSKKLEVLNWTKVVKPYGKDSVLTTLPWSAIAVPQETSEIFEIVRSVNEEKSLTKAVEDSLSSIRGYVLHYNRKGMLTDPLLHRDVPPRIAKNRRLLEYLDSCMRKNGQIDFIQFYVFD